jgi:hypothetical protein
MAIRSIFIMLLILSNKLFCFPNINGFYSINPGYDSNPLIKNISENSLYTINKLNLEYKPDYSPFSASYSGNLSNIFNFPERHYYTHKIEAEYVIQPFKYEYFEINFAASDKLRNNYNDAKIYNYNQINAMIGLVLYSDIGIIYLNYTPSITSFSEFELLNNFQNELLISLDKKFSFETNLKSQIIYGNKFFNKTGGNHPVINGNKYLIFDESDDILFPNVVYNSKNSNLLNFSIEIEHPISENINLGLKFNKNIHLDTSGLYYASGSTDLLNGGEFFNDIYNFSETGFSPFLNINVMNNLNCYLGFNYFTRDYLYSLYLINNKYSKDTKRSDIGIMISTHFVYNPNLTMLIFDNMIFGAKFEYFNNESNLAEYKFENYNICFSIKMEF